MSQYEKVKERLLEQAKKVLAKINPKDQRKEVSNSDMEVMLVQYAIFGKSGEVPDYKLEELHERLTRLSRIQMDIIRLRYWEGATFRGIAKETGLASNTVQKYLDDALKTLAKS